MFFVFDSEMRFTLIPTVELFTKVHELYLEGLSYNDLIVRIDNLINEHNNNLFFTLVIEFLSEKECVLAVKEDNEFRIVIDKIGWKSVWVKNIKKKSNRSE